MLGKDSVFMDVDSIALGRDFRQVLQERLGSCDAVLALIGPGWLDAKDGSGARRLDNPTDLVRQEIAAALKRNIPVIPVLLQGAQMPPPERLPDDLKDLSYRNGFELSHITWESDVREMVKRLGLDAAATGAPSSAASIDTTATTVSAGSSGFSWRRHRAPAIIVLLVAAIGLFMYLNPRTENDGEPAGQTTPSSQPSRETVSTSAGGVVDAERQPERERYRARLAGRRLLGHLSRHRIRRLSMWHEATGTERRPLHRQGQARAGVRAV
jgi:hypothetical protein